MDLTWRCFFAESAGTNELGRRRFSAALKGISLRTVTIAKVLARVAAGSLNYCGA